MTKKQIQWLARQIEKNRSSYESGVPTVSDAAYDRMYTKLQELVDRHPEYDSPDLPIHKVGESKGKQERKTPMLSLRTFFGFEKSVRIMKGHGIDDKGDLVVQPKLDGVSMSVHYSDSGGCLVLDKALTRGDGFRGDLVENVRVLGLPMRLDYSWKRLEVRGEVIYMKEDFEMLQKKFPQYKSARNTVAGLLKRKKDKNISRHYSHFPKFLVWEILPDGRYPKGGSYTKMLESLRESFLFPTTWNLDFFKHPLVLDQFTQLYETDGIVIKVDDYAKRSKIGEGSTHPRWAWAVKPESPSKASRVRKITWQVGRTGRLTPVAEIDPVVMGGARISRVTLHNYSHMRSLGVGPGAEILVERRGGVIPKIVEVTGRGGRILKPKKCPSCNSLLDEEGEYLICCHSSCEDRDVAALQHSAKILGIKGISDATARKLRSDMQYGGKFWELLTIEEPDEKATKNIRKIVEQIHDISEIPFSVFLQLLNIEGMGSKMSEAVAKHFKSEKRLCACLDESDSCSLDIEPVAKILGLDSTELVTKALDALWYRRDDVIEAVENLVDHVRIIPEETKPNRQIAGISGHTIMVTGKFSKPRTVIHRLLKRAGGRVMTSLSRNVDILVVGNGSPPHKQKKANALGVRVEGSSWLERKLSDV